jgi:hypothetical protein
MKKNEKEKGKHVTKFTYMQLLFITRISLLCLINQTEDYTGIAWLCTREGILIWYDLTHKHIKIALWGAQEFLYRLP